MTAPPTAAVPPITVDVAELQRQRLHRAQVAMRAAGLAAALVFDPANVRYATCDGQYLVANLHCSYRWALVFAEHEPILWDSADQIELSRARWHGDLRLARGFSFFGSGPDSARHARRAMAEVHAELAERGLAGEPLGIDRTDAVAFVALSELGVRVADAVPVLEQARAVKAPLDSTSIGTTPAWSTRRSSRGCRTSSPVDRRTNCGQPWRARHTPTVRCTPRRAC